MAGKSPVPIPDQTYIFVGRALPDLQIILLLKWKWKWNYRQGAHRYGVC